MLLLEILIAGDNASFTNLLKSIIEKDIIDANCKVVSSIKELESIDLKKYDLILCDSALSDGSYIEEVLKQNEKVIVITQSENEFVNSNIKNKVIDFVLKQESLIFNYLINFIKNLQRNKNISVLIVDDDKIVLKIEENILKKINLNVFKAYNGEEALKCIHNNDNIDLVLTDLNMPKLDGEELLIRIRKLKTMDELPVVIISSNKEHFQISKLLKLGANDYLTKPFFKEELILRVNNLLSVTNNIKDIKKQMFIDSLTKVYNRLFLEKRLENIFNLYDQKAVAMLDIDFFKKINDTYGHQVGDEILKHFAKTIENSIRKSDYVIRYGGEEFLLFLPNAIKAEAKLVLYKIKKSLKPYKDINFTFSAGISSEGDKLAEMIKKADKKLYQAKREGRNRIVI